MTGLIGQNATWARRSHLRQFTRCRSVGTTYVALHCRPQYSLAAVPMPIESRLRTTFRFEALKSGSARVMDGGHGERYPMSSRQANLKAVAFSMRPTV